MWGVYVEFLVAIEVVGLDALPDEEVRDLRGREKTAGLRHLEAGTLVRMWRMPGRRSAIGLWRVQDAELHRHLSSRPLFKYLDITVTPLARHYLEEGE